MIGGKGIVGHLGCEVLCNRLLMDKDDKIPILLQSLYS